jgi:alginate O-acetyltransferase complex protein AlgJ
LKYLAEIFGLIDQSAAQYGGELWVVIPPDKNTAYPQYMPEEIPVIGQMSRLDQLMGYLQENTKINVLDLRPVFMRVSQSSQIYYKADTHWNCLGAYYASNELFAKISARYPEVQPHPLSDFELGTRSDFSPDISKLMGLPFGEDAVTLTPTFSTGFISRAPYEKNDWMKVAVNSHADLPTALVIHDSFYITCFDQLFEPQFSRVISSHIGRPMLSDYLELIEAEKPDIVVIEFVERHIDYFFRWMTHKDE